MHVHYIDAKNMRTLTFPSFILNAFVTTCTKFNEICIVHEAQWDDDWKKNPDTQCDDFNPPQSDYYVSQDEAFFMFMCYHL